MTVGDLILLRPPQCLRPVMRLFGINVADTLIKNILAGPGDTVFVDAKSFCINGIRFGALQENVSAAFINAGCLDLPYDHVLSADEYFVGSAYEESVDSRYFGPMTRSEILGKAKLVLKF